MKSHIITIAGSLGSGKTSTAKRLATELGYRHFSSGDLFRAVAAERGVTVEEINQQAELEHEIDHAVDRRLQEMASESELVIDSRMAFHWMPSSFRVYLDLDPERAAQRIHDHIKTEGRIGENAESVAEVLESIIRRRTSEQKRYQSLYGVDVLDLSPFNLVIDTGTSDLSTVATTILKAYREWLGTER